MLHAIAAAFVAGLVGSPHCLGMCGSFALACGGRATHTAAWHAGKTLTYAVLGAVAGLAGASVPGPTWVASVVSGVLLIWFAAALAGLTPEPALRIPGLARLASRAAAKDDLASRFVFGVANGLLPCGLVYATLGIAVASGSAVTGALAMAAFGLATVPGLALFGLGMRRALADRLWLRRGVALVVLLGGLWVIARRHGMTPGDAGHGAHGAAAADSMATPPVPEPDRP